tara:strand:+ start:295 stop:1053 length:759 start_codon:yes stop_codon:yes gene_type:complete
MNIIKIFLLTAILVSFTACSNQSDIDEAVATAVAKSLATPTAVPIPTATELPFYAGSPLDRTGNYSIYTTCSGGNCGWGDVIPIPPDWGLYAKVLRVIDGDTIEVEAIYPISYWYDKYGKYGKHLYDSWMREVPKGTKVRYADIDTPETVHPDKPVQCYGPESTLRNKQLVEGKIVRLEGRQKGKGTIQQSFDRYGRLLANVYTDQYFVNGELVWSGFAYDYKGNTNTVNEFMFSIWEADAKKNKRGLWGKC